MSARRLIQLQLFFITVVALQCLIPHAAAADEESLERARTLRDRAQFDAALEVFRKLSGDMSIDKDVRAVATFETAETLVYKSRMQRDPMNREGLLIDAQQLLKQFASEHGEHPLAPAAGSQLGGILVERAKLAVDEAKNAASPEDKEKSVATARKLFNLALVQFETSLMATKERLKATLSPLDPGVDREQIAIRDQLRTTFLQARLLIPATKEELADTYEEKSAKRRELLQTAADEFRECFEDYRTRVAGMYALLYQGRCHVKLDECDKALECFDLLLEQPDSIEVFRPLKLKSALLAADCWLDERRKDHSAAIDVLQNLIDKAKKDELRQQDWLWLRVKLARAYKLQAGELSKIKERTEQQEQQRKESASKALEQAREAAKVPGEHAEQARAIIDEISGTPTDKSSAAQRKIAEVAALEIKSFDEAYRAAREMLGEMNQPETRRDKALYAKTQREAVRLFQLALDSVDAETSIEHVNMARYLLAYLYFDSGELAKAAETGELVARRFSDQAVARPAARIAMAARLRHYKQADEKEKQAAAKHVTGICRHIVKTWPDDPVAAEAAQTLVMFALLNNKPQEALELLELVPKDAPKRLVLEVKVGLGLWADRLNKLRTEGAEDPLAAPRGKYAKERELAKQILQGAIERTNIARAREQAELENFATAALGLSQIHVSEKAFEEAVSLLEDKRIGPLTLVKAEHPAAGRPGFAVQAWTVATYAYRGVVEADGTDAETQSEAERKLKEAIVESDRLRKARDKRGRGAVDIDLTPVDE